MPTGTVKWFNNAKGYGFILPEDGGDELFAHYSAISMDGYRTLKAGQTVAFDVTKGDKGYQAVSIELVAQPQKSKSNSSPAKETPVSEEQTSSVN